MKYHTLRLHILPCLNVRIYEENERTNGTNDKNWIIAMPDKIKQSQNQAKITAPGKTTAPSKCIEKGAYKQRARELPVDKSDRSKYAEIRNEVSKTRIAEESSLD